MSILDNSLTVMDYRVMDEITLKLHVLNSKNDMVEFLYLEYMKYKNAYEDYPSYASHLESNV